MQISFLDGFLIIRKWESKNDLTNFVVLSQKFIILNDAEVENSFYSITIKKNFSENHFLSIGIISENSDTILPQLLILPKSSKLIIGSNTVVYFIDTEKEILENKLTLISPVITCLYKPIFGKIFIFHEIGVLGIKKDGHIDLNYSNDIVTNFSFDEYSLRLDFWDSSHTILRLVE